MIWWQAGGKDANWQALSRGLEGTGPLLVFMRREVMVANGKVTVTVRCSYELKARMDDFCASTGWSLEHLFRFATVIYLDRQLGGGADVAVCGVRCDGDLESALDRVLRT